MAKRPREHAHPEIAHVPGIPYTLLRPDNEMQALMESPPGVEPDLARNQLAPLRDIIADALNILTPRELWIFEALNYRKLSLRQLARELSISKTHIARIRDHIHQQLRDHLGTDPAIKEYLNRD